MSQQAYARTILSYALRSVLPEPALRRYVSLDESTNILIVDGKAYNLNNFDRIIVVGGGKAGRRTGIELVNILADVPGDAPYKSAAVLRLEAFMKWLENCDELLREERRS